MMGMRILAGMGLVALVGCTADPYVPPLILRGTVDGFHVVHDGEVLEVPIGFYAHISAINVYPEGMLETSEVKMSVDPADLVLDHALLGIGEGEATVTVTHNYNGTHAQLGVRGYALAWISIKGSTKVAVGQRLELTAYGWYGSWEYGLGGARTNFPMWTIADPAVVAREFPYDSQTLFVNGVAPGQTTITLTFADKTASIDVTVE